MTTRHNSDTRFIPDGLTTPTIVQDFANEQSAREDIDDPFFVVDLGNIVEKFRTWRELLPNVEPFYAVKCNSEQRVLQLLAHLKIGFDCASKGSRTKERGSLVDRVYNIFISVCKKLQKPAKLAVFVLDFLKVVSTMMRLVAHQDNNFRSTIYHEIETMLDLNVHPSKIIFANPCKQKSHLRYADKYDLYFMTFDNEAELDKVKATCPQQRLVLRILTDDSTAQCQLGLKYGCHPKRAHYLLEKAKNLDLKVIGVSFHVGSGCRDAAAYSQAISSAREVMNTGVKIGFDMRVLDIGGGFPGQESVQLKFKEVANVIKQSLEKHFPPESKIRVIAEPGRYFVASAFTLAVNVTAKRVVARDCQTFKIPESKDLVANSEAPTKCDEPGFMYYVNDGVYGSFNCLLYDHATVFPQLLEERGPEEPMFSSSLWGPSCDGLDRIIENTLLPVLEVGEWIYFKDMGAYTISAGSEFNGFKKPHCFYVCPSSLRYKIGNTKSGKMTAPIVSPRSATQGCREPHVRAIIDKQNYPETLVENF